MYSGGNSDCPCQILLVDVKETNFLRYLRWPLVTDACDSCCRLSFVCSCAISHMAGWPWRGPKTTEQVLVTLEVHHGCVTFLSLGLQYSVQKLANGSSPTIMIKQTKSGGI